MGVALLSRVALNVTLEAPWLQPTRKMVEPAGLLALDPVNTGERVPPGADSSPSSIKPEKLLLPA